jgi:valyl-tRNA synthetase
VRAIRNARAEYGVEPSRKIGAVVVAADLGLRAAIEGEAAALALLAKLEPGQVGPEPRAGPGAAGRAPGAGMEGRRGVGGAGPNGPGP